MSDVWIVGLELPDPPARRPWTKRGRRRLEQQRHDERLETGYFFDWQAWADEEQRRTISRRAHATRLIRPSVELPADLIETCDRIAKVRGMTRSVYIEAALRHYQQHWRPCPPHR